LLPTQRPYLLEQVFPQLLGAMPAPRDPVVWELSRFTAVDLDTDADGGSARQFSSPVAVDLLRSVLKVAAQHGVQRLITVSPVGVERLLRRAGFQARRAAPPMVIDGHPIFACWIDVPQPLRH
jgi:N-acyl-L-homoserine lactone synthetase